MKDLQNELQNKYVKKYGMKKLQNELQNKYVTN